MTTGIEIDTKLVQFVDSSLSQKLLSKFPDTSAFDFDYSQSALWSPPLRRFHAPISPKFNRRLSFDSEIRRRTQKKKMKKITLSKIKNRIHSCFAPNFNLPHRRLVFSGTNDDGCSDSPPAKIKGWEKVLKMASKQFKRRKKMLIKDSAVKLSDYLRNV